MATNFEQDLLERAFDALRALLDEGDSGLELKPYPTALPDSGRDAAWEITAPNHTAQLLVEAFRRFTPRDVDRVLGGISPLVRKIMRDPPILVVAPWLSSRARDLLTERGINYLDLTGNVRLRVARPSILLRLEGAQQDPDPPAKPPVRLQGASINGLIRVLVDYEPPYRMVELARAARLSNAYVSRALETLDGERLIGRPPGSKVVTSVDWPNLLRARAALYDMFKTNRGRGYISRSGPRHVYRQLAKVQDDQAVVTGSFAASEFVHLAAPAQLALYVPNAQDFAQRYELMPARQSANVVLLDAADESQLERARQADQGAFHVGVSQAALDCLAGNGRMPEEGEALVEWMIRNQTAWRRPELPKRD
ncbi:hypothetical protein ABT336_09930 [Micromonospora sp. NPDC000207]|uniref:hypothetical protein n=1 Tax=Micromonospora sp. NPDC000207 TaxID=3154246 RepID=UPI003332FE1B